MLKMNEKAWHNLYYQKRRAAGLCGHLHVCVQKRERLLRIAYKRDDSYSLRVAQIA